MHKLSKEEWISILLDPEITKEENIQLFQAIYSYKDHKVPASVLAKEVYKIQGKNPHSRLSLQNWRYAQRINKSKYKIDFTIRKNGTTKYWDIFFSDVHEDYSRDDSFINWKLRTELIEALIETKLVGEEDQLNDFEDRCES
ncbi:MAG: hypothetical protein LBH94_07245, partial [Deltaproteobacteria bacterium]|nr:hypothetical protein [Deltaproteobacteria bacterium]